jgi:hypothetical protein
VRRKKSARRPGSARRHVRRNRRDRVFCCQIAGHRCANAAGRSAGPRGRILAGVGIVVNAAIHLVAEVLGGH